MNVSLELLSCFDVFFCQFTKEQQTIVEQRDYLVYRCINYFKIFNLMEWPYVHFYSNISKIMQSNANIFFIFILVKDKHCLLDWKVKCIRKNNMLLTFFQGTSKQIWCIYIYFSETYLGNNKWDHFSLLYSAPTVHHLLTQKSMHSLRNQ